MTAWTSLPWENAIDLLAKAWTKVNSIILGSIHGSTLKGSQPPLYLRSSVPEN